MKYIRLNSIAEVEVEIVPGDVELYLDVLNSQTNQKVTLPGRTLLGKKWSLTHQCANCGKKVRTGFAEANYRWLPALSLNNYSQENLYAIASLFTDLIPFAEASPVYTYAFITTDGYKSIAEIFHYYCQHCHAKYLAVHAIDHRGEVEKGPPEQPNYIHLSEIIEVDFDENTLFE